MNATRPRYSVLNLFDPLASSSGHRSAPSPDSDKENSSPPADCSMTAAFFGHAYKQSSHPSPVILKRRLVDIGDITIDDPSFHAMLTDEEELDDGDDGNDTIMFTCPPVTPERPLTNTTGHATLPPSNPRTPLGNIDLDATPIARTKTFNHSAPPPPPLPASWEADVSSSRDNTNLASVVDAVNSSGTSFAVSSPTVILKHLPVIHEDLKDVTADTNTNQVENLQITISPPDTLADSLSTLTLDTPTESLTDTARPFGITPPSPQTLSPQDLPLPRLRPGSSHTSSHDPNRRSIDLYSSFQLQLQSEEASFDLLNDKISFLASGSDSFLNAMDDDNSFDIDIEEANMEKALEKIRLEDEAIQAKPHRLPPPVTKSSTITPDSEEIDTKPFSSTSPEAKPGGSEKKTLRKRLSFGFGSNPSSPVTSTFKSGLPGRLSKVPCPTVKSPVFVAPSVGPIQGVPHGDICTPPQAARDTSLVPPPAVPALKIVKRAKRASHEKSSSSGSASSSEPASTVESAPVVPPPAPSAPKIKRPTSIPATGNPQAVRYPPDPTATTVGVVRASGPNRGAVIQPTAVPTNQYGTGPRRVPIIESRPSALSSKVVPAAHSIGARRVPIAVPTPAPAPVVTNPAGITKAPSVSGLRAPTKYAGIGGVSALPRPTSRLPAPAMPGIRRTKTSNLGVTAESTTAGTAKGVPIRRMAYSGQ